MMNVFDNDNVKKSIFVYETYLSLRLHFTDSTYDFIKFRGKTRKRITTNEDIEEFVHSKNYIFSSRIAKKKSRDEIIEFLIANLSRNSNIWLEELTFDSSMDTSNEWKKRQEALTYTFIKDLNFIFSIRKHFNSYFRSSDGYSDIVNFILQEKISIESAAILNWILNWVPEKDLSDFVIRDIYTRIRKYTPILLHYHSFTDENKIKFKKIIKEKVDLNIDILSI